MIDTPLRSLIFSSVSSITNGRPYLSQTVCSLKFRLPFVLPIRREITSLLSRSLCFQIDAINHQDFRAFQCSKARKHLIKSTEFRPSDETIVQNFVRLINSQHTYSNGIRFSRCKSQYDDPVTTKREMVILWQD
jgi:hypothetical protein